MNKPFYDTYLNLLRTQVEDEISFLKLAGHNQKYPDDPCMFCQEYKGKNVCHRLSQLRDFLSTIQVRQHHENQILTEIGESIKPIFPLLTPF